MSEQKRFYSLTDEGRAVWSSRITMELPLDYRRVLGLVEFAGHLDVIRSHLGRYDAQVVDRWLAEFEELRLIERVEPPKVEKTLPELAQEKSTPPLEPEDKGRLEPEVSLADVSLTHLGVYVAHDRIANRAPSTKRAAETTALVVEDDPDQLALAVLRLTVAGYKVQTVDSVGALFRRLEQSMPDAIFLDIGLPDGDGFDVLVALRRHPAYASLPIIMLTARSEPQDVARGLELGCDGYVTKPYGRNTLEYMLRYVMKQEVARPDYSARTPESRISFSQRS